MKKVKNKWLLKFILPGLGYKRTIYEDGLVYGEEYNQKIGILDHKQLDSIKNLVNDILPFLKNEQVFKHRPNGSIIRINDTSRNNRSLKIIGWNEEKFIWDILNDESSYYKLF